MFPFPFGSAFSQDPFLQDPFAQMNMMMNNMFNTAMFPGHAIPYPPTHWQQQQRHQQQQGFEPSRAPIIEEVHDEPVQHRRDHTDAVIVEEPDDEDAGSDHRPANRPRRDSPPPRAGTAGRAPSTSAQAQAQYGGMGAPFGGLMPGATVYSYSSSSSFVSSGGPGGVTYSTSSTTRVGPGGVRETRATVEDGRTGTRKMTLARGLGDKERIMTRERDAHGRERAHDDLRGLQPEQAEAFDAQWQQQAAMRLPGYQSRTSRLPGGGWQQQQQFALPSAPYTGGGTQTYSYSGGSRAGAAQQQQQQQYGSSRSHMSQQQANGGQRGHYM